LLSHCFRGGIVHGLLSHPSIVAKPARRQLDSPKASIGPVAWQMFVGDAERALARISPSQGGENGLTFFDMLIGAPDDEQRRNGTSEREETP